MQTMRIDTSYLDMVLGSQRDKTVEQTIEDLYKVRKQFSVIAYTGHSGACIAPIVAYQLGKPLLIIRKELSSHSSLMVEGIVDGTYRVVLVDDIIVSGETTRRVRAALRKYRPNMIPWKVYLWRSHKFESFPSYYKDPDSEMKSFFPEGVESE